MLLNHIKLMLASGTQRSAMCSATCNASMHTFCHLEDKTVIFLLSNYKTCVAFSCIAACALKHAIKTELQHLQYDAAQMLRIRPQAAHSRHMYMPYKQHPTAKLSRHDRSVISNPACCGRTYSSMRRLPTCKCCQH